MVGVVGVTGTGDTGAAMSDKEEPNLQLPPSDPSKGGTVRGGGAWSSTNAARHSLACKHLSARLWTPVHMLITACSS